MSWVRVPSPTLKNNNNLRQMPAPSISPLGDTGGTISPNSVRCEAHAAFSSISGSNADPGHRGAGGQRLLQRFEREVQATARLSHFNRRL